MFAHERATDGSALPTHPPTCQVHPELLTKALLQRMQERGGSLQLAAVTGVQAEGGRVTALQVRDSDSGKDRTLPADAVVFAMGACRVHDCLLQSVAAGRIR